MHHIDKRGCFDDLESALDHAGAGTILGLFNDNPDALDELLETGSVTLATPIGKFVFTLGVWEEKS